MRDWDAPDRMLERCLVGPDATMHGVPMHVVYVTRRPNIRTQWPRLISDLDPCNSRETRVDGKAGLLAVLSQQCCTARLSSQRLSL